MAFIQTVTAKGAAIHADEAIHWDVLHDTFPVSRINHSEAYCKDGACTNQAESYFSRLRRMVQGQHHFVSPRHLHQYAAMPLGQKIIAGKIMVPPPSALLALACSIRLAGTGRDIGRATNDC